MREDEGGAALHQPIQRLLDDRLVLRIDRGQRLVEDQDRRVAQQRPGDGDALALPARQPDAPLSDHGVVTLREPGDELVGVRGARRGLELPGGGVGLAEPEVVRDGAVKEIGLLVHHRDTAVDVVGTQSAQIVPADTHHPFIGVVEAHQQPDDGGLPRPALPHEPDPLARLDSKRERPVRGAPPAGIRERDVVELHHRRERAIELDRRRRRLDLRECVEHREDVVRGGAPHHAVVQQRPQIALRAKHLDAHHQDDEQHVEPHLTVHDPPCAEREHRGAADRDADVGQAAGERVGREHPHRAPEDLARPLGQKPPARRALAERLEGGETLYRVEELRREPAIRLRAAHAAARVPSLERGGRKQGEHREGEHQGGDREVEPCEEREDDDRSDEGDEKLRQVLAEVGLELLDAVDHRDHDRTGALEPEVGGAKPDHLCVEPLAQLELDPCRGVVGDHGAGVLDPAAQHHHRRHQAERDDELGERVPGEDPRQQPAEQREPADPDQGREHPHRHRSGDAKAHAARELPESGVEEHGGVLVGGSGCGDSGFGSRSSCGPIRDRCRSARKRRSCRHVLVVEAVTHLRQDGDPSPISRRCDHQGPGSTQVQRRCTSDRRGRPDASSWRKPPGDTVPVAASSLHAGNHVRTLGSTGTRGLRAARFVKIDGEGSGMTGTSLSTCVPCVVRCVRHTL